MESNQHVLTVTVGSFSYRNGYPSDDSGNGGGFVFDCRAIHNPGRYDRYKQLTGNDTAVAEFLEERGEVFPFLQSCRNLVAKSIDVYLRRGFTSLSVWYGCTGGRHRSLYCAENTAKWIAETYPQVSVRLIHREQEQ